MKPRLVDLMCGAGGATRGYQLAGFHVTGVDIEPQPHYIGDEFHQADALTFPLDGYDAIAASPPCQAYSQYSRNIGTADRHPQFIGPTRERLQASGVPWVIENVPGAPIRPDIKLCGCMFGLQIRRVRWFETSWRAFAMVPGHDHSRVPIGVYGHGTPQWHREKLGRNTNRQDWADALGIQWMSRSEMAEAIPPSYTHFVGELLLAHLSRAGARAGCIPGPPTSSSPAAPRGARAPDGMTTAPALGAQSEAEVAGIGNDRSPWGRAFAPPPRTHWRPAFVDNDARPIPTTRENVPVQEGVL